MFYGAVHSLRRVASLLLSLALLAALPAWAGLVNGGMVSGTIATAGQTDTYTFFANAGETVTLTVAKTSGTLSPYIRLYSPSGAGITSSVDPSVASISHSITVSGTYTVLVSDNSINREPTGIGGYEVRLARMPGANEHGGLINGSMRTEQITLGDLDTYTFFANAGETVTLTAAKTSGTLSPYIRLYSPSGAGITSSVDTSAASISHSITVSGTYTVLVSDNSINRAPTGIGGYEVRLARMPGANEHGGLVNGGMRTGQITLGDLDTYTFFANAGETVILTVAKTSGKLSPYIRLYSPSGAGITSSVDTSVASISHSIAVSGTYTVLVSDNSINRAPTGIGGYEVRLARMRGANEHGGLINGGMRTEQITLGDLDTYTFFANAGETVTLTAAKTSGTLSPYIRLYSPSGAGITSSVDPSVASILHSITVSGTYTVLVSDNSINRAPTGIGRYQVALSISGSRLSYAALGDSYSSGEGIPPYLDLSDLPLEGCHRSTRAYPTQIRWAGVGTPISKRSDSSFDFLACSGAVTANVRADGIGQLDELPQMHPLNSINDTRDLITVTIGGNDAEFIYIFAFCLVHPDCNGLKPFEPHSSLTLGELAPLLVAKAGLNVLDVHARLKTAAPSSMIVVGGYPILVSGKECSAAQFPPFGESNLKLSASEQSFLRDMNALLNDVIEESARFTGLHFVDLEVPFTGHEVCGDQEDWINGVVIFNPTFNPKASVHPTARGQLEYANAFNAFLASTTSSWKGASFSSGLPRNPDRKPAGPILKKIMNTPAQALPQIGTLSVSLDQLFPGCEKLRQVVVPGQAARLRGDKFVPHEAVTLTMITSGSRAPLGVVAADSTGALDVSVSVPTDVTPGTIVSIEALGVGPEGVGRLLMGISHVQASATIDTDSDGVPDICDNCSAASNADQLDTDGDGFGNACDADFDNNGIVNTLDLAILKAAFGQRGYDKITDLDGNFIVNTLDLAIFRSLFGKTPGPAFKTPDTQRTYGATQGATK